MDRQDPKLREIWKQKKIPVVYRQAGSKPLLLRLPYTEDNRGWVKGDHRNNPEWNSDYKCWETPRAWFENVIRRALTTFGSIYIIQPYREFQKCAPACWDASGIDCECSCMGQNHGAGNRGMLFPKRVQSNGVTANTHAD
jgi:hypothetical protein